MRWSPVPVIDQKDEPQGLPDETRRHLHALRRENAAKQFEAALLPLSADPVHETSDQFLFRAREHWNARVSLGKKHGLRPAFGGRKWREFDRDLERLLKFQIDRVTFTEIAERPSAKPAVEKAVRRLARLLKLELRPLLKGGDRRVATAKRTRVRIA
jgi:hypothetical protein